MSLHIEAVTDALNHNHVAFLPRGELFIDRSFLDHFFSKDKDEYVKQLETAAQCMGLSVLGVEINGEWSRSLLFDRSYKKLEGYFTVGCINGPVARLIENYGFFNAMLSMKEDPSLLSGVGAQLLREVEEKARLAHANRFRAIAIADDIAGNKGLLFSFSYFLDVVWPIYRRIAEIIKESGLFAFFHLDGDMRKVVEPLIRAGYDCIHPVDTQAGLNLYELKKEFSVQSSGWGVQVMTDGRASTIPWSISSCSIPGCWSI